MLRGCKDAILLVVIMGFQEFIYRATAHFAHELHVSLVQFSVGIAEALSVGVALTHGLHVLIGFIEAALCGAIGSGLRSLINILLHALGRLEIYVLVFGCGWESQVHRLIDLIRPIVHVPQGAANISL